MANTTGPIVGEYIVSFANEVVEWPLVSTAQTYYPGAMVGLGTDGYLTKFDDAASLKFAGIVSSHELEVESGGSSGDKRLLVKRPRYISMATTGAAITDVGKLVYAAFDNSVQLTTGTYGNVVGRIVKYVSATRVLIDTWDDGKYGDASRTLAATGNQTLTIFDLGKNIFVPNTAALTITLPAVAECEVGSGFKFIKTTSDAEIVTLDGNASETIDGSATYTAIDAQYDCAALVSTGSAWVIFSRDIA